MSFLEAKNAPTIIISVHFDELNFKKFILLILFIMYKYNYIFFLCKKYKTFKILV